MPTPPVHVAPPASGAAAAEGPVQVVLVIHEQHPLISPEAQRLAGLAVAGGLLGTAIPVAVNGFKHVAASSTSKLDN